MAYVLAPERIDLTVDDLTIEVAPIIAPAVYLTAVNLMVAAAEAQPGKQIAALRELYEFFVTEAQPTWQITDHRGPVFPTAGGCLRLPMGLALVEAWTDEFSKEPPATAADAILSPGPVLDAVNAKLRRKPAKG